MTLFVLGVIVGWVLEYIAYTFWWKGRVLSGGDASTERTDFEARLSAKDREIAQLQLKLQNAAKVVVEEKVETPISKKADQPEKVAEVAPTPAKEKLEKKEEPVANAVEPKAVPKKAAKKSVKKKAPAKKAAKPKASTTKTVPLTTISGIGAVIGEVLSKEGFDSAASLATVDEASIQAVLEKAEIRPGNIASWIEQAKLIDAGDMEGLAALKKTL